MEFSKYNIYTKDDGLVTIYNTLSSAIVQLGVDTYERLLTDNDDCKDTEKELLSQGILVKEHDEDIRKYKYIQYSKMFRNNAMTLYICPTINCNFACSYCFEAGNKKNVNMSEDVENAIVRFLVNNKDKKISIIWFGGEPLLNVDIIKSINDKLNNEYVEYSSSIITNGSLLTERAVEILNNIPLSFIQISMDGTKDVHDKRRHMRSGIGSFELVIEGIKRVLTATSIPITIQVAIDKTNYMEYENLLTYFNDNFAEYMDNRRIQMNYNVVKDRTDFDTQGVCMSHQDYLQYLMHLNDVNLKNKIPLSIPGMSQPCMYAAVGTYAIAPDGEIYKCIEHIGDKNKSVGNLLNESISLSKLSMCALKNNYMENQECVNCSVLPICGGGCPLDRDSDNGKNNKACSFYKMHINKILSSVDI